MYFKLDVIFDVHVKAKSANEAREKVLHADKSHVISIARNMRIKVEEPGYEILDKVE